MSSVAEDACLKVQFERDFFRLVVGNFTVLYVWTQNLEEMATALMIFHLSWKTSFQAHDLNLLVLQSF